MDHRRPIDSPTILETANGETTITEKADTTCAGIRLHDCLLCPTASSSLLATVLLTDAGWAYMQSRQGAHLLSPDARQVKLVGKGNLFILAA